MVHPPVNLRVIIAIPALSVKDWEFCDKKRPPEFPMVFLKSKTMDQPFTVCFARTFTPGPMVEAVTQLLM